jgi:O-antigen/teichoic acid export membrane protein
MNLKWPILNLSFGVAAAQILSLTALPIITNTYLPSDYGKFIIIISAVSIFVPFSTFRLETIIIKTTNNEEFTLIVSILFKTILKTTLLSFLLFFVIQIYYFKFSNKIFFDSLFFSFILLIQSSINVITQIALKLKIYNRISMSGVVQNFLTYVSQFILGLISSTSKSLLLGYIIGRASSLLIYRQIIKENYTKGKKQLRVISKFDKKYYPVSKYLTAASIIESILYLAPSIIIGKTFGLSYSGYIGAVQTLLIFPTTLFGSTFGSILFSEFNLVSNKFSKIQKKKIFSNFTMPLLLISLAFIFINSFAGPAIFNLITNDKWADGAILLRLLAFSFGINILWKVLTYFFYLTSNWLYYFYFTLLNLLLALLFVSLALLFKFDWTISVFLFFIGQTLGQIIGIVFAAKNIFNKYRSI